MSDMAYTFNWQEEPDGLAGPSFLRWVGVNLLTPDEMTGEKFEEVSRATDDFKAITLTVQVNGIPVDATWFFGELEKAVGVEIAAGVRDQIKDSAALTRIDVLADRLTTAFREHVFKVAEEAGIEFPDDHEWD